MIAFSDKIKESVNFFKSFNDESDFEVVHDHWSASHDYRRTALRKKSNKNIAYMFENWPVLKRNYGYDLVYLYNKSSKIIIFHLESSKLQINFDFEKAHGHLCTVSLDSNWKDIVLITSDLRSMIHKKQITSLLAKLPSKGKNFNPSEVCSKMLKILEVLINVRKP